MPLGIDVFVNSRSEVLMIDPLLHVKLERKESVLTVMNLQAVSLDYSNITSTNYLNEITVNDLNAENALLKKGSS